jgi:NADH dehydrogenase
MHYDIVIVGGGAGGLELAAQLGRHFGGERGRAKVLLIDRSSYHVWKPTLHEVAAGTLDTDQEGLSYALLARRNHFSFALGELARLDGDGKRLTLAEIRDEDGSLLAPERSVQFGSAVLAIGSGSNFFDTPGAAEHAFVLEQTADAERFHKRLLSGFARASFEENGALAIAIVGGGATGVELSAELLEAHKEFNQTLSADQAIRVDLALVEAADRILGGLPERISAQATKALTERGVRVLTSTPVRCVSAAGLETSGGPVPADLVVWAAGVKAPDSNAALGPKVNRSNQFEVDDRLRTSAPDVYALGDCAACPWRDGEIVPPRAQAAHQQAGYLARALLARLKGGRPNGGYVYRDFGSLVSLGESRGVGSLMGSLGGRSFFVEGMIAKWMYASLHLAHHLAILGPWQTFVLAFARLLQQRVSGRLKLH